LAKNEFFTFEPQPELLNKIDEIRARCPDVTIGFQPKEDLY
jgi:hypothetical protein